MGGITDDVSKDNDKLSVDNGFLNVYSNRVDNNANVGDCVICCRICRKLDRVRDINSRGIALQYQENEDPGDGFLGNTTNTAEGATLPLL